MGGGTSRTTAWLDWENFALPASWSNREEYRVLGTLRNSLARSGGGGRISIYYNLRCGPSLHLYIYVYISTFLTILTFTSLSLSLSLILCSSQSN